MSSPEACPWCHTDVSPTEAHEVQTALAHLTPTQKWAYSRSWGGPLPALLCARCFNPMLTHLNNAVYGNSENAASPL